MTETRKDSPVGANGLLQNVWRSAAIRAAAYVLIVVAIFAAFVSLEKPWLASLGMGKEQADFWDVAFKGIGGLVAIVGAAVGLSKYFDERAKTNRAALIEAQKPFSTKRQEVYFQLVSATAAISNKDRRDPLRGEAEAQFWLLFWGAVPMVADDEVGLAVNAFSVALDDPDNVIQLRNTSMDPCRKSLGFVEHTRLPGMLQ
jgi:hypothetical protein